MDHELWDFKMKSKEALRMSRMRGQFKPSLPSFFALFICWSQNQGLGSFREDAGMIDTGSSWLERQRWSCFRCLAAPQGARWTLIFGRQMIRLPTIVIKSAALLSPHNQNLAYLSYSVLDLFAHISLFFILTLAAPFCSVLFFEFYANLHINFSYATLTSYVNRHPVEIIYQDYAKLLQLSTTGDKLHTLVYDLNFDCSSANHFLGHTNAHFQVVETSSLLKDARTIQHVLRTSIILKARDRVHITPILSLTTFYILAHRKFNATYLIFHYIEHLITIRDPGHKRKPNLALGLLISYVLESKYQLQYPTPPNHPPPFYSNNYLNALHSTHLHLGDGEAHGAGEEEALALAPVPKPVPLCQHSQLDQLVERFYQLETRFNTFVAHQQQ
ncbi:hypothetical protein MA16_Dca008500 [Dendrobium catenatum]|uniref:Uncharacterized protein n=1 Tax=Dendrobium catenatum TaxID=906689 RepID=A0A2I0XHP6_9ASPA|nr:hypothetical protein MA16_Dca008500 [Dendrobium catenatum]